MSWDQPPHGGETYRCPRLYVGKNIQQRQETRKVIDRSFVDTIYRTAVSIARVLLGFGDQLFHQFIVIHRETSRRRRLAKLANQTGVVLRPASPRASLL